ncbi:zinc carboxypeptidase [Ancylostoma caninum]|uniref:Zinc carboxypeptidase n=1 Tax=Ancylostoma caninum TaxID=29170 RepID=A0A368FA03_ANCCA|nr:zinc carboxypeptidase [Ancylostoma caninum]
MKHLITSTPSKTCIYFVQEKKKQFLKLTSRYKTDPTIKKLLEEITFVIVPCVNPDGYEFTRSSTNPHIRLWRKNRSSMQCRKDSWGRNRCCRGVDLNRNFDFHFKESGSSDDPCSEIYQGTGAFSEPEARAVRDAILSRRYKGRVDAFITLHTYSQIWIHPYGHRKDSYPGDIQELIGTDLSLANRNWCRRPEKPGKVLKLSRLLYWSVHNTSLKLLRLAFKMEELILVAGPDLVTKTANLSVSVDISKYKFLLVSN